MSQATRLIDAMNTGDPRATAELLPIVYHELRRLARNQMAREATGHTLQATALVHEAYLRLVDVNNVHEWNSRGHFFAAAAEAMRRILIERARRSLRLRHGGGRKRLDLERLELADDSPAEEILALNDALERLAAEEPAVAELVKLRYFAGLTIEQAAATLEIS